MQTRVDEIRVGRRHRKDLGDIEALAASMETIGQLHAIGITEAKTLVFGQRRLLAAKQLGWSKIETKVVDIKRIVQGEHDENVVRKDFTKSEMHDIRLAIEEATPKRQGQRTSGQLPGSETREKVAKDAGFESSREATRVASVIETGNSDLVELMDSGEVSVSAAAEVTSLPKKQLTALVEKGPAAIKYVASQLREKNKQASYFEQFKKIWDAADETGKAAIRAFVLET